MFLRAFFYIFPFYTYCLIYNMFVLRLIYRLLLVNLHAARDNNLSITNIAGILAILYISTGWRMLILCPSVDV